MKIELTEQDENTEVIQLGSIRISAFLKAGKTVLILNTMNNSDFIVIMPTSGNQIVVKADQKIY